MQFSLLFLIVFFIFKFRLPKFYLNSQSAKFNGIVYKCNLLFLFIPGFSVPRKKLIVLFMTEARDVMRS